MRKKLLSAGIVAAVGAGVALTAVAQVRPDVQVKQRQAVMTLQGKYIGPLVGMMKGSVPYNNDVAVRNAAFLDALSQMPWDTFSEATKGESNTKALPAIWTNAAGFKKDQDQLRSAVGALNAAAKSGNEANVKSATGEVLKACNSCHDEFRAK
jgi:cytochrome c556